jgi:hypothetical protein
MMKNEGEEFPFRKGGGITTETERKMIFSRAMIIGNAKSKGFGKGITNYI